MRAHHSAARRAKRSSVAASLLAFPCDGASKLCRYPTVSFAPRDEKCRRRLYRTRRDFVDHCVLTCGEATVGGAGTFSGRAVSAEGRDGSGARDASIAGASPAGRAPSIGRGPGISGMTGASFTPRSEPGGGLEHEVRRRATVLGGDEHPRVGELAQQRDHVRSR